VLLTGFGPFPGTPVNATMVLVPLIARAAQRAFPDIRLVTAILPTEWTGAPRRIDAVIEEHEPDVALHFGVSSRATGFDIEARGRNRRACSPDAAGCMPDAERICAASPPHLPARLPAREIAGRLRSRGIAANVSRDAGGYLCNALLFHVLARARRAGGPLKAGFIHVPQALAATPIRSHARRGNCRLSWVDAVDGGVEIVAACLGRPGLQTRPQVPLARGAGALLRAV
jgi:pyroglutamyl-peptidase